MSMLMRVKQPMNRMGKGYVEWNRNVAVVFALRAIYFALLEEGGIPVIVTGTATGFISMLGFTPDIFMPLLGGILLDSMPTVEGYRAFFISVAVICGLGLVASIFLYRLAANRDKTK